MIIDYCKLYGVRCRKSYFFRKVLVPELENFIYFHLFSQNTIVALMVIVTDNLNIKSVIKDFQLSLYKDIGCQRGVLKFYVLEERFCQTLT